LATAADNQFTKLEANVNKVQTQIETRLAPSKIASNQHSRLRSATFR
jgi:hypothetical protein